MSESSRINIYPHTLRLAAMANVSFCTDKALLYLVPPYDAITIENLFCHFKFTFDASVPSGDRVVEWIGVCNEFPVFGTDASYLRKIDLNQAADGDRKVDIKLDLSSLLQKTDVNYREYFDTTSLYTDGFTYCIVKLPNNLSVYGTSGVIDLWKLDGLFTTKGIH